MVRGVGLSTRTTLWLILGNDTSRNRLYVVKWFLGGGSAPRRTAVASPVTDMQYSHLIEYTLNHLNWVRFVYFCR